jgi:hypothetical protein
MSRSKDRRGAKGRRAQPARARKPSPRAEELEEARQRAAVAKTALAASGAFIFAVGMMFARHSYAGHTKQPATALAASPVFVDIVKQNLLQAGVLAPAQAPPGASTAVS